MFNKKVYELTKGSLSDEGESMINEAIKAERLFEEAIQLDATINLYLIKSK